MKSELDSSIFVENSLISCFSGNLVDFLPSQDGYFLLLLVTWLIIVYTPVKLPFTFSDTLI
jgi:hypothetical protein